MKRYIANRNDIEFLVDTFYTKVKAKEVIGYIFNDVLNFSWGTHIPIMYSFWETMLLDEITYKGNPMLTHIELSKKTPLKPDHFACWQKLFLKRWTKTFYTKG